MGYGRNSGNNGLKNTEPAPSEWDDQALWEAVASWEDPSVLDDQDIPEEPVPVMQLPPKEQRPQRQDPAEPEKPESTGNPRAALLTALLLLLVSVGGLVWCATQYVMVGFRFYPKHESVLDLRGESLSAAQYEKLKEKLPDCVIYWDVRFQGKRLPSDTEELTVTSLSQKDIIALDSFPSLKTIDATGCTDYENLALLEARRPELELRYQIVLGSSAFSRDSQSITLDDFSAEDLSRLPYLHSLQTVTVQGGSLDALKDLQDYCHGAGISFQVLLGEEAVPDNARQAQASGSTDRQLALLPLLTQLEQLRLVNPQALPETISALQKSYPGIDISLELRVGSETLDTDAEEVDLSGVKLKNLEQVESLMRYLPNAKQLFLGVQDSISNDDMAVFRERNRDNYKVVWEVRIGDKKTLRTDITYFMPGRDWAKGPVFGDDISYNLRYCEDLISVDVGHLGSVKEVTWLEGLVNLEYLILAHTDIRSLDGIQNCKKLKFLEVDWTGIKDLTPLKECTALEDLNIGHTAADITPLLEMPWLKNIYMIFGNGGDAWKLSQALPDTHVVVSGTATVSSGWRRLPNYYAMRDALHAYYMN